MGESCIWKFWSTAWKREFNVEATVGKPQVAYRETIRKVCNEVDKFVQQSGGRSPVRPCGVET